MQQTAGGGVEHHLSAENFITTVERLNTAVERLGMKTLATIDHAAEAQAVGLHMPSTMVFI